MRVASGCLVMGLAVGLAGVTLGCGTDEPAGGGADAVVEADEGPAPDEGTADAADEGQDTGAEAVDPPDPCLEKDCDDGLECTEDSCVEGACLWAVAQGACLVNGVCASHDETAPHDECLVCDSEDPLAWTPVEGVCPVVEPPEELCPPGSCDDQNPLTEDLCDPETGDCSHEPFPCDDGDACTQEAMDAESGCVLELVQCQDGNPCTADVCDSQVGCYFLPIQTPCCAGGEATCNDGDPCTDDLCHDTSGECQFEPNSGGACDDGLACTVSDTCDAGTCGGNDLVCDDSNPCSDDSCAEPGGCSFFPLSGAPCDDGLECSTGDLCLDGVCSADTSECQCEPVLVEGLDVLKVSDAALGADGKPGSGLDVDGDPETCSPPANCSGGVDNSFAILAPVAGPALSDAVASGQLVLLLAAEPDAGDGFEIQIHQGEAVDALCDFQTQTCDYLAKKDGFDEETCAPAFVLPATLEGPSLVAGGPGSTLPFSIPIQGALLEVTIFDVAIEAQVTLEDGLMTAATGVLGGAMRLDQLLAALETVDPDTLDVPIEIVVTVLTTSLNLDMDTDGDGTKDAASIGMTLTAIDGALVGVAD